MLNASITVSGYVVNDGSTIRVSASNSVSSGNGEGNVSADRFTLTFTSSTLYGSIISTGTLKGSGLSPGFYKVTVQTHGTSVNSFNGSQTYGDYTNVFYFSVSSSDYDPSEIFHVTYSNPRDGVTYDQFGPYMTAVKLPSNRLSNWQIGWKINVDGVDAVFLLGSGYSIRGNLSLTSTEAFNVDPSMVRDSIGALAYDIDGGTNRGDYIAQ